MVRINQDPNTSAPIVNLVAVSTPALGAQTSIVQSATLTAPSTPGTYYVWVLADDFSEVTNQTNTANDIARSAAFTVVAPANSLLVSPGTNLAASGPQGGPFSSSSVQYQISASSGIVNYSVSVSYANQGVANWLNIMPATSGGVGTNPVILTVSVNSNANSLAPGTYNATINFTNTGNNVTAQRGATLTVAQPGVGSLQVSSGDIISSGPQNGPFSPDTFTYQLSATSGSIGFSIANWPNWLTPLTTSGTASTSPTTVTFLVNSNAELLSGGTYGPTAITFANTTNGQGNTTRNATLTVAPTPVLQVTPATDISVSGNQGGPFPQTSFSYTLSATTGSVNYQILYVPSWLTLTGSSSGTVTTSGTTVTFTLNASANSLLAGGYSSTILFSNVTTFFNGPGSQTRFASLLVKASGTGPSFQGLGFLPGDSYSLAMGVSSDGNIAVGSANQRITGDTGGRAFRWDQANGMVSLGILPGRLNSEAYGTNSDGSVGVGDSLGSSSGNISKAFSWANGTLTGLPYLLQTDTDSTARAVNSDGSIIVGFSLGVTTQAVRWVNGNVSGLGWLPGSNISNAYGVNSDGTVVVGFSCNSNNCIGTEQAFRWVNGTMSGLGFLPGGNTSFATAVNSDGTVVGGYATDSNGNTQGFRWVNGNMTTIAFPGSTFAAVNAVNGDGTVMVGISSGNPGGLFRWTSVDGIQSISNLLTAAGVNFTGWALSNATGVSNDGTVIVGTGTNPSGQQEGWIARLPLPAPPPVPVLQVTPTSDITASGSPGGPFTPNSFPFQLSASSGSVGYAISGVPNWLTASSTSGTATTSPATITFSINSAANILSPATYTGTITFTNTVSNVAVLSLSTTLAVNAPTNNLSVSVSGNGTVTSSPPAIDCMTACSASFASGIVVTLTPFPANGWSFNGWSGACTGNGGCSVTMNTAQSVAANFIVTGSGPGSSTSVLFVDPEAGTDTGACPQTAPCQTLNYALFKSASGSVIEVESGGVFGPIYISQPIAINGPADGSASIVWASTQPGCVAASAGICNGGGNANYAVEIAAGTANNPTIALSNILIDNGSGSSGAVHVASAFNVSFKNVVLRGGSGAIAQIMLVNSSQDSQLQLYFSNCDIGFSTSGGGLLVAPTSATPVNTLFQGGEVHNGLFGLKFDASGLSAGANIQAGVDNTKLFSFANSAVTAKAASGGSVAALLSRSTIENTGSSAFNVNGANAVGLLFRDTITANQVGVAPFSGGPVLSIDNNEILGNWTKVSRRVTALPPP